MADYHHYLACFLPHQRDAQALQQQLLAQGLSESQISLFAKTPHSTPALEPSQPLVADPNQQTLDHILADGAVGGAVGTALGALVNVGLVAAHTSLFVANPLLATLTLLGWGGSVGALVGGMVGATQAPDDRPLSELIADAVKAGHVVVLADTTTAPQTEQVRQLMREASQTEPLPASTL